MLSASAANLGPIPSSKKGTSWLAVQPFQKKLLLLPLGTLGTGSYRNPRDLHSLSKLSQFFSGVLQQSSSVGNLNILKEEKKLPSYYSSPRFRKHADPRPQDDAKF